MGEKKRPLTSSRLSRAEGEEEGQPTFLAR